ncbi:MAG: YdcF family protein [Hyphomicrobiaceae bacterium]
MTRISKWLVGLMALASAGLFFGFVVFATTVMREPDSSAHGASADGIVVLTGGKQRLAAGSRLLKLKRGKRLLISGVNPRTSKRTLAKILQLDDAQFECCVDLGYEARNTLGNAQEASNWARERNFRSLIVVTSSYHMPRSLAELSRRMPDTKLIAHPVTPEHFKTTVWWLNPRATRVILTEYLKYLPAAARLVATRYLPTVAGSKEAAFATTSFMVLKTTSSQNHNN